MDTIVGSVKNTTVLIKPSESVLGEGRMGYTSDFSIYDWGKMEDSIPGKDASLCLQGAYFFEPLNKMGFRTHYICLEKDDGSYIDLQEVKEPVNKMHINLVRVIKPKRIKRDKKFIYDYSVFKPDLINFLIPLEIIYRNRLPKGSSIFKRLKGGEMVPSDLELDHYPKENEKLKKPVIDLSTKLEKGDKYPSWKERWEWAKRVSGMNDKEIKEMQEMTHEANKLITKEVKRLGLDNGDGKFEFAFDPYRRLMLVDVLGTQDECRFTINGLTYCKEATRQYYESTQPEWIQEIRSAKAREEKGEIEDWKSVVKSKPKKMDPDFVNIIAWMYQSYTNALLDKNIFDAPTIDETAREYTKYLESMK